MTFKEIFTEYLEVLEIHYKGLKDYGNLLCWVDGPARQAFVEMKAQNEPAHSIHFDWWDSYVSLRTWFHKLEAATDGRGMAWAFAAIVSHAREYEDNSYKVQEFFDLLFVDFASGAAGAAVPLTEFPAPLAVSVLAQMSFASFCNGNELQRLLVEMEQAFQAQQEKGLWFAVEGSDPASLAIERTEAMRGWYEEQALNQKLSDDLASAKRDVNWLRRKGLVGQFSKPTNTRELAEALGKTRKTILAHAKLLKIKPLARGSGGVHIYSAQDCAAIAANIEKIGRDR